MLNQIIRYMNVFLLCFRFVVGLEQFQKNQILVPTAIWTTGWSWKAKTQFQFSTSFIPAFSIRFVLVQFFVTLTLFFHECVWKSELNLIVLSSWSPRLARHTLRCLWSKHHSTKCRLKDRANPRRMPSWTLQRRFSFISTRYVNLK